MLIVRAGLSNPKELMDAISIEKMTSWFNYFNECVFQYCEAQTRRLGYFVKVITLQDLNGVRFIQERRFFKAMGASSKMNEWLFPQLIGKTVLLNSPGWVKFAFTVASKFMSPKSIEKVWVSEESSAPGRGICSFAARLVGQRRLPTFLGGLCECEGGCVGRLPNTATAMRSREEGAKHRDMLSGIRRLPRVDEDPEGLIWCTPPSTPHGSPQFSRKDFSPWNAVPVEVTPRLDESSKGIPSHGSGNVGVAVQEVELNGSACGQPGASSALPQQPSVNQHFARQPHRKCCCRWCPRRRRTGDARTNLLSVA